MEIVDPLKYSYQAFSNVVGKLEYSNDMVDDTHDLLTMTRFMGCGTRSLRDAAFKNLYVLVCCVAFEAVSQMDRTRRTDLWVRLKQTFNEVLQNYPRTNRAQEYLFSYFGSSLAGGAWPKGFLEYVQEKQNAKPTSRFKRDYQKNVGGADGDEIVQVWFQGFLIDEEADICKRYINNNINPLYTDDLPSGRTKQQLFNSIRRTLWLTECVTKARKSAYNKMRYDKKSGEKSLVLSDELTLSDAIEAAYLKMRGNSKKNLEWYPDCWITFLMLGRGCEDKKVSQLFNGGMLAKDSAQVFGPNEIIAKVGSKAARKVYYEQTNRSTRNETTTQQRPTKRQKIVTPMSSISGN